jgi:endonuclease IV
MAERVGIHACKGDKDITSTIKKYMKRGMSVFQIFTHGPHGRTLNKFNEKRLRRYAARVNIYSHSSYRTSFDLSKTENLEHLHEQMRACAAYGLKGLVVHLPKDSVVNISRELKRVDLSICPLFLEMKALKQCEYSFESPEKINALVEQLIRDGFTPEQTPICLDTAHINAGCTPLRTRDDAEQFLNALRYPEWIQLLHLNGNEYDCHVRAGDKHAVPLSVRDTVWRDVEYKESGCRVFIHWFAQHGRDIIVETDEGDELNTFLQTVRSFNNDINNANNSY